MSESSAVSRGQQAKRVTLISALTNICLSSLQIIIGVLAHSQALLADGFHTLSDLLSDFVVLFAQGKSSKKADEDHQYGHARYENAASMLLGVVLGLVGLGMLYRAGVKIASPNNIAQVHILALWMAMAALLCKEILFRYMLCTARRLDSSLLEANAWHARSDAASSLIVALGILGNLAGYSVFDPLAALLVGLMILRIGAKIAWSALSDLMDQALPSAEIEAIKQSLLATHGVLSVHDLRSRRMGDTAFVDVHIEVAPRISVTEGHCIACQAQSQVLAKHKVGELLVHIDPPNEEQILREEMLQRADIETIIEPYFSKYPDECCQITLHYLEDIMEIEIIVPTSIGFDEQNDLLAQIQKQSKHSVRIKLLQQLRDELINPCDNVQTVNCNLDKDGVKNHE